MREILFRGRDTAHNWRYGVPLIFTENYVCITKPHTYNKMIIPETIGQYTGLTDKNGTKIFEGDILKGAGGLYRVYFDTSLACFEWAKINGNWHESFSGFADEYEIIGNIYDNPELLGGDVK